MAHSPSELTKKKKKTVPMQVNEQQNYNRYCFSKKKRITIDT